MSRGDNVKTKKHRRRSKPANRRNNGLSDVANNLNMLTGGSYLSGYNTIAHANNYSLITLNRIILTYLYTGNGVFQTAVQLPIQDAIKGGVEIQSSELDNDDIEKIYEYWEEHGLWQTVLDYMTWVRLYGGGAIMINSYQNPEKKLTYKGLDRGELEFYDLDRWQLDTNLPLYDGYQGQIEDNMDNSEYVYIYGQKVHQSRLLKGYGKKAPKYVRQQLRGWGMSEGERMIRDINMYIKTQDSAFELIDEAKIDVYKINGLAQKMLQKGGVASITSRIQSANQIKNFNNALVLDSNEEYMQKVINFSGLSDVMNQNRMGLAASIRMPETKLFGISASGFNTGESDLENYNSMVESEIRTQIKPVVRKLLKLTTAHLFGYEPSFSFGFKPLREMTAEVEQNVKNSEYNRLTGMYDRGLITSEEYMQMCRKTGIVQIETKTEQGLNPDPEPPEPSAYTEESDVVVNSLTFSGHKLQGKEKFQGLGISIENKPGSIREGVDVDGKAWKTKFKYPYGYIRGSIGVDGDHVDCYLGGESEAEKAYIIRQNVPETGKYDEDKVMLGFNSKEEAEKAYRDHYNKDGFFGGMKIVTIDKLKKLLEKRKGKKL